MDQETIETIEQIIGYHFSNKHLLAESFTHASSVDNRTLSNERLEFLGDAILGLVICKCLYQRFENYLEGDLTKIKSMLVSRKTCSKLIKDLGVLDFLKVGKGMSSSRALNGSLAAGLFESLIAAIYLDGGFEQAEAFILTNFNLLIEKADAKQSQGNYKSMLQQYAQQQFNTTPSYELLDEKGPDHNKCFEAQAVIQERYFPSAWGTNKKEAEQQAAYNALVALGLIEDINILTE